MGGCGIDLSGIDRSVVPCEDFYRFANGVWLKSNPIPAITRCAGDGGVELAAASDVHDQNVAQVITLGIPPPGPSPLTLVSGDD